jgi:tetratricopeptide (TPR) repeat protein
MSRSYYHQLALAPLGPEAVQAMLAELVGSDPSVAELAKLIRERSQGNPFFIEELVRSLAQDGSLDGERGDYRLVRAPNETAVPANVQAVLAARIDRLASRDKRVLQAAAVIGRDLPQPVLEQVVELDATQLDDALHTLIAAELVYERDVHPEPVLAFTHQLTREVAYRSQLAEHRRAMHAAVARAFADHYPDRLDEQAALLAQHWEAAGQTLEATRWHARAAAWSGNSAPSEALGHWRKVRELADALPESAETTELGLRARVSLLDHGWRRGISREQAEALFDDAERMAEKIGHIRSRAVARLLYGAFMGMSDGDVREYAKLGRQAIALAKEAGDHALYVALVSGALYGVYQAGEYREAVAYCDRAIELADGDPSMGGGMFMGCPLAHCHGVKGLLLAELGDVQEALRLNQQARHLAREQRSIETLAFTHQQAAQIAYVQGEPEMAHAHAREAVDIAERIGSSFSRSRGWLHLGVAEQMQGEWRRAIEALERSAAIARDGRTSMEQDAERRARLAESHLGLGDMERARALAEQGLQIAREKGQVLNEIQTSLALARVLLGSAGLTAGAQIEAALRQASKLARQTGAKAIDPQVHVELAELARQAGDGETHERELRNAHRLFTEIGASGHVERLSATLATPTR